MADSENKRNWLLLIAIAAMVVLLWDDGPNLFRFGFDLPFWPLAIVVFAIWWMSGGKHHAGECCGGMEGCCSAEPAEAQDVENDEELDNKG